MTEFVKAVAALLVECGESAAALRQRGATGYADGLLLKARRAADTMSALTARPDADKAALLLLSAGNRLAARHGEPTVADWLAADRQAMALLGVVPLTVAEGGAA